MVDEIHYVTVETARPRGDNLGQVDEGFYRIEGDVVVLVTAKGVQRYAKGGKPIRSAIGPGETARKVAWRLTKQNAPSRRPGFNGPISYFNPGKI